MEKFLTLLLNTKKTCYIYLYMYIVLLICVLLILYIVIYVCKTYIKLYKEKKLHVKETEFLDKFFIQKHFS